MNSGPLRRLSRGKEAREELYVYVANRTSPDRDSTRLLRAQQPLSDDSNPVTLLTLKRINGREILASCAKDGAIKLWDVTNPRAIISTSVYRQESPVGSLVLSGDGHWMATTDAGRAPFLWNLLNLAPRLNSSTPRTVKSVVSRLGRRANGWSPSTPKTAL
jgi:WD40 repeat protein